jgi:MFS family permease
MDDPRLIRHRPFVLFWCARTFTNGAYMMQTVAVGWQLYDLTHNPFDLGLIGMTQFLPLMLFSLVIGHVADRFDRRIIASSAQAVKAVSALVLALGSASHWLTRETMLAVLCVFGTARAFEIPTIHALLPGIVPTLLLPRAVAASVTAQQTAVICGPSLGGLLYGLGPAVVYATCTFVFAMAGVLFAQLPGMQRREAREPLSLTTLFAGFAYIRSRPILLGAISLDLFAVLLGGVTALLPIYARDILHAGPWALGVLRSAPAVGALATSILLARSGIGHRAGSIMFGAVGTFGLASLLFALSDTVALSCLALVVYGASDAISVVIRQSLIQMRTPYEMLGRVMAVNSTFTGSSGSLGEFRAGAVAAWLGPVPSALIGGVGAIMVMIVWMFAFPQLRRVDKLAA